MKQMRIRNTGQERSVGIFRYIGTHAPGAVFEPTWSPGLLTPRPAPPPLGPPPPHQPAHRRVSGTLPFPPPLPHLPLPPYLHPPCRPLAAKFSGKIYGSFRAISAVP